MTVDEIRNNHWKAKFWGLRQNKALYRYGNTETKNEEKNIASTNKRDGIKWIIGHYESFRTFIRLFIQFGAGAAKLPIKTFS